MRTARYKVHNGADVGGTTSAVSSAIPTDDCNGYFAIFASLTTAGPNAKATWYYEMSDDGINWAPQVLATERAVATYFTTSLQPPVSKFIRITCVGTSDNSAGNTVTTKLLMTE